MHFMGNAHFLIENQSAVGEIAACRYVCCTKEGLMRETDSTSQDNGSI